MDFDSRQHLENSKKDTAMYICGNKLSEILEHAFPEALNKTFLEVCAEYKRRGLNTPVERVTVEAIRGIAISPSEYEEFESKRREQIIARLGDELEMYKNALEYFAREGGQPARDIIKNLLSYGGVKNE